MKSISARIADELAVRARQVDAAIALLDERSSVPFIERLRYLRELEERTKAQIAQGTAAFSKLQEK